VRPPESDPPAGCAGGARRAPTDRGAEVPVNGEPPLHERRAAGRQARAGARIGFDSLLRILVLVLLHVGDAVGHPLGRRRILQVMVEELEEPDRQVLAIRHPPEAVALARIRE
jgi:hypothetical protein